MLRILLFCTKFGVGGIARHALELGTWLKSQGHAVTFAGTPGAWRGPDVDPDFVALDSQGVSGGDHGASMPARLVALARSAGALRRHLARQPVDLIHAHESAPALVAKLATLGGRTPIILTYHGAEPARAKQFASIAKLCATKLVSVSDAGVNELVGHGFPRDRALSIGLGVKPPPAITPSRVEQLRTELLGEGGRRLVVTIARLSPQKGIETLIEVSKRVRARDPGVRFVLVGDGPQEAELRSLAAQSGAAEGLTFVGRSEEPHLYLAAADAFLLTSRWEALPFTIVEAFQAGLPAIATDCGGVRELISAQTGRVTGIGDVDALADAVLEIVGDDTLRSRMSTAARKASGEDRFKPDVMHGRVEALYREVVSAR
jgi:glycosyltransferase involved in cell wall biosynthesis